MISEIKVSGAAVEEVLDAIEPILEEFPRHTVLVSLMTLVVLLQSPDLSSEELQTCVKSMSEFMVTLLVSSGSKELMN